MALSDLTVRQAKTTGKRYTLSDNDCLGLMVSAAGGKSWQFRYYWLGKQKRLCLGGYPALSLREARIERDKAQALLARGIDPQVERDQKRHAAKLAGEYTFKTVFDAWVEHRRKELKEGRQSTLSQILRIFNKDMLPTLGRMSIYDIRRPQLLGVLAAIEKRKAFTTAEKVRTWFNQLFRYALVIAEGLEVNPAADLDVVAEPKPPRSPQSLPAPARDARVPPEAPALQPPWLADPAWRPAAVPDRGAHRRTAIGRTRTVRPRQGLVDHPTADRQAAPG